jgi:RNA polymerase sigma-70 factor (ECF subfamily)
MSTTPVQIALTASPPDSHSRLLHPTSMAKDRSSDAVTRAQAGDCDAFSEVYSQHKRRVFSICMRIVRDFSAAEDLTQEIFLLAHRKLATFRGDSAFSTWLHRLAVNTVLMHLRKRCLRVISLDNLLEDTPGEQSGRNFGTRDLAQAGIIDRMAIDRALESMAPGYRSVFILHNQGFDHDEIASILKCTSGTSKSQLHKARRILRGALATKGRSGVRAANCNVTALPAQRSNVRSHDRGPATREATTQTV